MWDGTGKIRCRIYACSPEDPSFTAVFTDMCVTECMCKVHDGQAPDEEQHINQPQGFAVCEEQTANP